MAGDMPELRVPTLQHLARNWREEPRFIANALVRLAENPPRFNYNPLFGAIRDLLVLNVPYEQIVEGIKRIRRDRVRENLLGVLPLIRDHFSDVRPDFCQTVDRRFYPVGRGLMVPFEPPILYGVDSQFYFPWFSFWRSNPIIAERMSLFVTLVDEVLLQDPDLETARFEIPDFSISNVNKTRALTIINAADIPRVDSKRKVEMLEIFADGFFRARDALAERSAAKAAKSKDGPEDRPDPSQPDFPGLF